MSARGLIDDEHTAFLRGPVACFLGTVDALGAPDATRVVGLAPVGGDRMRLLVSSLAATALRHATHGARVAVIVTDIFDYRSVQWKGVVVEPAAMRTMGDVAMADEYEERFSAAVQAVGLPADRCWRLYPDDVVPLVVEVQEMFDQTPGPSAGRRVEATR